MTRACYAAGLFCVLAYAVMVSAAQGPSPLIAPFVQVSVTPEQLDFGTVRQTGQYDSPAAITVHVAANCPHSGVVLQAGPLQRSTGGSILPEDVFVKIPATGQYVPMAGPVNISGPMGPGVGDLPLQFRVETTAEVAVGTYEGLWSIAAGCAEGPATTVIQITVKLEISRAVSYSIQGNEMYFHYGLPGDRLAAVAQGEVSADIPVRLSLSVTTGRVDCLPMVKSFSGSMPRGEPAVIPLVWNLRENASAWREPDARSLDGTEIHWVLATAPDKVFFYELQCCPLPDATQAPGDYAIQAVLTIAPVL